MPTLNLPTAGGRLAPYLMQPPRNFPAPSPPFNRVAYAAAHVVADPLADREPWLDIAVDWDTTIAFRRYLWSLGLGVAEAMDTAQRGMGMDAILSPCSFRPCYLGRLIGPLVRHARA